MRILLKSEGTDNSGNEIKVKEERHLVWSLQE